MKIVKRIFTPLGLGLLGLMLVGFGTKADGIATELVPPDISIVDLHSPRLSSKAAQLICTVKLENPNDIDLPVTDAILWLKLNKAAAAKGRLHRQVIIPARGTKHVDVLVNVGSQAVSWLPMFLGANEFTVPYELNGFVELGSPDLGRLTIHELGDVSMTSRGLVLKPASDQLI